LASARELADADALFRAAIFSMNNWMSVRQWPRALQTAHEFRDASRRGVSQHTLAEFLVYSWGTFMEEGERELAGERSREIEALAAHTQDAGLRLAALVPEPVAVFLDGKLEESVARAQAILVGAEELGSPAGGESIAPRVAFRPLLYLGRAEEALVDLHRPTSLFNIGQTLVLLAHIGPAAEARARLRETLGRLNLKPEEDDTPMRMLAGLLEAAVLLEEKEAAALLAPKLVNIPGMWWPLTCVALHVARAFALVGDREAARVHYARALDWTTRMRHRPELALTRLGLAELLLDEAASDQRSAVSTRTTPPDELTADRLRAEGSEHLDFAIGEFQAMKMQPALERALRLKGLLTA
jgi:hypothetical protein